MPTPRRLQLGNAFEHANGNADLVQAQRERQSADAATGNQYRHKTLRRMIRKKPAPHLDSGVRTGFPKRSCANNELRPYWHGGRRGGNRENVA
jgi:hypothetical protein